MDLTTGLVHGDRHLRADGGIAPAIAQTSTYAATSAEHFLQIAAERRGHGFYTRYGNPNHAQVAALVAEAEGAEAAMITASGMAAITTAVLALTSAGDHVVAQHRMFAGTSTLVRTLLPRFGVTCTEVDQTDVEARADPELAGDVAEVDLDGLRVTNSAWAIARLVRPSAAIRATRSSLGVRASTPLASSRDAALAGGLAHAGPEAPTQAPATASGRTRRHVTTSVPVARDHLDFLIAARTIVMPRPRPGRRAVAVARGRAP